MIIINMRTGQRKYFGFIFLLVEILLILANPQPGLANTLSFLTYYSAPHGAFDRIKFTPINLTNPCNIGTLSVDQSNYTIRYCGGTVGTWGALDTTWMESGNYVYPTLTTTNPNIFIGIGTSTPEFKLTLDNDGGILAMGVLGSGQTLSDLTVASENRLIWYPAKAAFRVGTAKGTSWNDTNIGNYTVAFGIDNKVTGTAAVNIGGGMTIVSTAGSTSTGNYATLIEGGYADQNLASGDYATLGYVGSGGSTLTCSGQYCVIMGVGTMFGSPTIASGISSTMTAVNGQNRVLTQGSTVRNGSLISSATAVGQYSTVGAGLAHKPTGDYSTIGGGGQLANTASGLNSTISGGYSNTASSSNTTVGGGYTNNASGTSATIAGGNSGQASGTAAMVTGGFTNKANANYAAVIGGNSNTITGAYSVSTSGQQVNPNTVSGLYSAVLNGDKNSNAGDYSLAAGEFITMTATADHTFYWGIPVVNVTTSDAFIIGLNRFGIHQTDITATDAIVNILEPSGDFLALTKTTATPGDVFIVKNNGYIGIGKYNPSYPLEFGSQANGAYLTVGGVFTNTSSRKFKQDIQSLTPEVATSYFQQLKPVQYQYKSNKQEKHLGFIAEDAPSVVTDVNHRAMNSLSVTAILTAMIQNNSHELDDSESSLKSMDKEVTELLQTLAIK